jgi:hypothetical protein
MEAVPSTVGPFGTKLYQVGLYSRNIYKTLAEYRELGYEDWSMDHLIHRGYRLMDFGGIGEWDAFEMGAELAFNYDIAPLELELLRCGGGVLSSRGEPLPDDSPDVFLNHMCARTEHLMEFIRHWATGPCITPHIIFVSEGHSNSAMRDHRVAGAYYDFKNQLGYDLKVVSRIPVDSRITAEDLLQAQKL